jgi:thermitase
MKQHIVIKLRAPLRNNLSVPYWVDFITDKSVIKESINAEIDHLMAGLSLRFWLAREYKLATPGPSAEEVSQGLDRTYRLILQHDYDLPPGLVERIRLVPSVEEARALAVSEAPIPTPELSTQQALAIKKPPELIYLPFAHSVTRGSKNVRIAVLDTGVDLNHPELKGRIVARMDCVDLRGLDTTSFVGDFTGYDDLPDDDTNIGHATHVSGIIGAHGLEMDEGVAPECSLMVVKVLATMKDGDHLVGAGIVDNINTGIKWAVDNGADVINMSLGIRHTGGGLPHKDVISYALSKNVTVVAASGNDGTAERYYPGALSGVIAVGAADERGDVARFTSYGAPISVIAPGSHIYSSFARQGYAYASGTSQASPFVAGAVGLMKSYALTRGVTLTNATIAEILKRTSERVDRNLRSPKAGYGMINLADAFRLLHFQLG